MRRTQIQSDNKLKTLDGHSRIKAVSFIYLSSGMESNDNTDNMVSNWSVLPLDQTDKALWIAMANTGYNSISGESNQMGKYSPLMKNRNGP